MTENKTRATTASVKSYLAAIKDESRRQDCEALAALMTKATKEPPTMWGTSIVGFGSYHYKYDSGREGDACLAGFSSRKGDISIYLLAEFPKKEQLLAKLGKHKMSGSCLHVGKLADVDQKVLAQVVLAAFEERKRRH
jgi:hypothetical protein